MDGYPRVYSQRYVSLGDIVDIVPEIADYLEEMPFSSGPSVYLLMYMTDFVNRVIANGVPDSVLAHLEDIIYEVDCDYINVEW
jgi:hypothetical protein